MLSIKYKNNIIEMIKIYNNHLDRIQEISTTISASFINGGLSSGSGFLIEYDSTIYVATAAHVILNGSTLAESIYVTYYKNGKNYFKQINTSGQNDNVYYNILTDVALLKLNDDDLTIIPISYANSRSLSIGSSSIVISGGYEDDIDNLDYILYTGQGGQDVPGGKQVSDQEFTRGNKGLLLSKEYNLPVRVTRGFQVEHGPDEGYRYDGLYYVTLCERVIGKSGHYVCRFHLESEKTLGEIEDNLEGTLPKSYEKTDRTETTVNKIKRSIKLREKIKKMYDHKCQVCGILLEKPNGAIAIGAHIKGLGKPHNGPDSINNMLCLCPNHHDQFDALSFYIESSNMKIVGLKEFKNKKLVIKPRHKIDIEFLDYQKERYELANAKKT